MKLGTIKDMRRNSESGPAVLVVEDPEGNTHMLLGDNVTMMRNLNAVFDLTTAPDIRGKKIRYEVKSFGGVELVTRIAPPYEEGWGGTE